MINEQKLKDQIEKTTEDYRHVLDCYPASVQINAPRALMQQAATSRLDAFYEVLGKKRPRFKCDESSKVDY